MKRKITKLLKYFTAFILMFIGLVGIILPILPGVIFIVLALSILYTINPTLKIFIEDKIKNYPKLEKMIGKYIK